MTLLKCGVGEDSSESLGLQGDQTSPFWRRSVLNIHWKDWWWSWSPNTLAAWCKEMTQKRSWCWERLKAGGEGDDRGHNDWMASLTQWTGVWANSGRRWRTGKTGMLQSMGSLSVGHDWATSLSLFTFMHWRRKWQPTPVFLPGESQGRRSLVGCHLWGHTELDMTEVT